MAVSINVLSTFNDAGLKKARAEMDKLSKSVQSSTSKTVKSAGAIGAGVLAGAGVAVGALYTIGSSFDDAYDKLRVGTGKSGADLEMLKQSFRNVATAVPASFDDVSTALSGFASNLGLSGQPLESLSAQVLNLSRVTGTDLQANIESVSGVMKQFGVGAMYQGPALDMLFRASQQTGVSITDLASSMKNAGPVLQASGFDFTTSAAFVGQLAKAGLDVTDVMPALSKNLALAAKNGKDSGTALGEAFTKIKNAPTDIAGAQAAIEAFGPKGAKMAEIIRSGAVSFDELKASITSGDSVNKAATDTEDFGEKFTKLRNRIMLAIEPFASKVFDKIGEVMDWLGPKVEAVTNYFKTHEGVAKVVAGIIGGALVIALIAVNVQLALMAINILAATWPIVAIIVVIGLLIAAFIWAWNNLDWFREGVSKIIEAVKLYFQIWWDVVKSVFNWIWGAVQWVWEKFNWLKDNIGGIFQSIGDAIVAPFKWAFNLIVDMWNATAGSLKFDIPSWVPGLGGKSFGLPKLVRWAHTGGIVGGAPGASVPMMLQTGEMVLSQDQQAMLLGRANGMGGGSTVTINVSVSPTADKAAIGQSIAEALAAYERRAGAGWRAA